MSIKVTTEHKTERQDTLKVHPDDVKDGRNSRMIEAVDYAATVKERAISIFNSGQIQPAEVRRDADKSLVLTLGYTRRDAVKLLREGFDALDVASGEVKHYHKPDLLFWVKVVDCDVDEAFLRGLRENRERSDTTDLQEALAHSELRTTMGWTDTQIAREYGYTNQNRVMALQKLLSLDEKTQGLVHAGKLALYTALDTLAVADPAERAALIEGSTNPKGKVDGSVLRNLIRDLLDKKAEKIKAADGAEVITDATVTDADPVVSAVKTDDEETKVKTVKRSVSNFKAWAAEVAEREEGISDEAKDFVAALVNYFAGKKGFGEKALYNRITELVKK